MYYSPLRYPGGKGRLTNFMINIIKENDLSDSYYIEPFAGGAAIALALLTNNHIKQVVINDIDRSIYAFWFTALNNAESFCKAIEDSELSVDEWEKQKFVQDRKEKAPLFELGFSTFYLNRVNRSGILKGGLIGGKAQSGTWKMDARFNKNGLINRIRSVSALREKISLYNFDATSLFEQIIPSTPTNSLLYLDPPYYKKGQQLYVNFYTHKDHLNLSAIIKKESKRKWIVTYDNTPETLELYKEYRPMKYSLSYSAATKTKGDELMFFSENMTIPESVL